MKLLLMVTAVAFLLGPAQSLPLLRSSIFGRRRATERPLLALSLESSETAPARAPEDSESEPLSAAGELEDYDDEDSEPMQWDHHPPTYHELWASTSQSFYDVLLNVLQLVGNQVRQEVQRTRVQQAAALHPLPISDEYYDDDDDYGDYDDAYDDDLMV
ncbi:uncharacterized protein LOC126581161 [Anopheles aquasalis]|uniref:uncharacterized protein LOC126581161 n=1 Tax=Anopheles aquasalis TaxID=42839 RepID=UPI00215B63F5|nr:uncharacterized protein LOC126581161 [Anopheles aquasalis]